MSKFHHRLRKVCLALAMAALTLFVPLSSVLADSPLGAGQPGVECEDVRPGHSSSAPGSALNEDGHAGTLYIGERPQSSVNPHSVLQYDVACFQAEQHSERI